MKIQKLSSTIFGAAGRGGEGKKLNERANYPNPFAMAVEKSPVVLITISKEKIDSLRESLSGKAILLIIRCPTTEKKR